MLLIAIDNEKIAAELHLIMVRGGIYSMTLPYSEIDDERISKFSSFLLVPESIPGDMARLCTRICEIKESPKIFAIVGDNQSEEDCGILKRNSAVYTNLIDGTAEILNRVICEFSGTASDIKIGNLRIIFDKGIVAYRGKRLVLTKSEFSILHFLASVYPSFFAGKDLLNICLASNEKINPNNIPSHISVINKKAREFCGAPVITNVKGKGYTVLE